MKKVLWIGFVSFFVFYSHGIADEIKLRHLSTWQYQNANAIDLDIENNHLYLGDMNTVAILDMDYPYVQKEINTIKLKTTVADLFYHKGHLFVSISDSGFIIFDVSDPLRPYPVKKESMCNASFIHFHDQYAGVITPCNIKNIDKNFAIYNISNPQETFLLNWVTLSGLSEIRDLFIEDNLAYFIDMEEGITVYHWDDLVNQNARDVQMIGVYDRPGTPKHIVVKNQLAYISDFETGFSIIDYNNPERPQERSCKEELEFAMGSVLIGDMAIVATFYNQLWVLNIENPDDIKVEKTISIPGEAYNIYAENNFIFVSSYDQMFIYKLMDDSIQPQFIANPQEGYAPLPVSYSNTSLGDILSCSWDFGDGYTSSKKNPSHTYTTPGQYTVTLSVSDGNSCYKEIKPNYITVLDLPPKALFESNINCGIQDLLVKFKQKSSGNITEVLWDFGDGNTSTVEEPVHKYTNPGMYSVKLTVFGPGGEDSLLLIDYICVKNNARKISEWNKKSVFNFCVDKERSIGFASTQQGIDIMNISNPFDLTIIQTIPLKNKAENLYYTNLSLFAACGMDGIFIFDISNPSVISETTHLPLEGFANHIWIENDYAYVSTKTSKISIISLLKTPEVVSYLEVDGEAYSMKFNKNLAFIAEGEAGIFCYKKLNPVNFIKQSFFEGNGRVLQFELAPKGLFLAADEAGLLIIDFNYKTNEMFKKGSAQDLMPSMDVFVKNDYAFVACGPEGLRVLDVNYMEEPIEVMFDPSKDISSDVVDDFPYLYLSDGKGGLRIFVQPETNNLNLHLPETIQEGTQAFGKICLPYVYDKDITVYLSSSHPQTISLPESINIKSCQMCSSFDFPVKESLQPQDKIEIRINAKAKGFLNTNGKVLKINTELTKEYKATDIPKEIPDTQSLESIIIVKNEEKIKSLSLRLVIKHESIRDINAYLIAPNQKSISLFSNLKIKEDTDVLDIVLKDSCSRKIDEEKWPLTGCYKPESPLSEFNGLSVKGEWKLLLNDTIRYVIGSLESWTMLCTLSASDNVPPEARPDYAETDKQTAVIIPVLENDFDPNNDNLKLVDVSSPKWGKVEFSSDKNKIIYTPFNDINNALVDEFDYSVSDGKELAHSYAKVNVSIPFKCENTPITIPPGGLTAKIFISSYNAVVKDLNVRISIKHPAIDTLNASLTSPSNNRIFLFENIGEGGIDIKNIIFNDEAEQMIDHARYPLTGAFRPMEALSELDNDLLNGEWLLSISNENNSISGTLMTFDLLIFYSEENEKISLLQKQGSQTFFEKLLKNNIFFNETTKHFNQLQTVYVNDAKIQLIDVPPLGNRIKKLKGKLVSSHSFFGNIVVYIKTDVWNLKPRIETPLVYCDADGYWECDITTKAGDENASKIAVFVFSDSIPLLIETLPVLPESLFQKAIIFEILTREK